MKPKTVIVIGFLIAVGVIVYAAVGRRTGGGAVPPATGAANPRGGSAADPGAQPGADVEITLEYSTEKKDWLEAAVGEFQRANPRIRVQLIGKGSLEAAGAILDGTDRPVLWSPADSLVANLLAADWKTKNQTALFPATGDTAPQPLVLTPLVFVVWEERARVLVDPTGGVAPRPAGGAVRVPTPHLASLDPPAGSEAVTPLTWSDIRKAVASPKGWAGIGGKPAWGFVNLGHTDPNKSNSGMQALALMAYEYFHTTSGLTVEQLLDPKFQDFVKDIERGVPHFESSTGTFMTDMIRFGPSKYDIAVVYESLAVSQLENAQGRWGSLHIYYPPVTIWSDHPIALLDAPWVTPAQARAGAQLIGFLRSVPIQTSALRFGFRPADTSVPVKAPDGSSPFARAAPYGLSLELPPAAQPPDGTVIRNMLMMWSRVIKPK
jgi:hypothetical protein